MEEQNPHGSRFVTALFIAVFTAAAFLMLRLLAVYLAAIVLALVLRTLFGPMHHRIEARVGYRRQLAAAMSTGIVALLVIVPLASFVAALSMQAVSVYDKVAGGEGLAQTLRNQLDPNSPVTHFIQKQSARFGLDLSSEQIIGGVSSAANAISVFAYEHVGGVAGETFEFVMNFFMMILVLFGLFAAGSRLKDYLFDLSPLPDDQELMLVERFKAISRAVFVGNGIGSLLQGGCGAITFYAFGLGNGILWGAAIAFFAFLPIAGASVIVAPAALYLFLTGAVTKGILFTVVSAVYIGVLEYGLKTRLIGGKSQMDGVLVFVGIVAGLSVFGVFGLFYGPLVVTMFLTLAEIYKEHYRDDLMSVVSPWMRRDHDRPITIAIPKVDASDVQDAIEQGQTLPAEEEP